MTLRGTETNVDGPIATLASLPQGFGDCYLQAATVYCSNIATLMASPEIHGPMTYLGQSSAVQRVLDSARWNRTAVDNLSSAWEPNMAPLWRDGEVFGVEAAEVDTNAVPTVDVTVFVTVTRRRNMPVRGIEQIPIVLTS